MKGSTCTQRVLMAAAENGVKDYKFQLVDLRKGEHKQPEHLARQPFGVIPALQDANVTMYESRAIARYVDAISGGKLTPKDPKSLGLMEQWISLEQGTITPEVSGIVFQRIFAPMFGRTCDEAAVKNHVEKSKQGLDIMDAHLAKNEYLAGSQFTLADVFYIPYFQMALGTPEKDILESRPHIAAWLKKITSRPTWTELAAQNEFAQQ